jgi:hypothetical protein
LIVWVPVDSWTAVLRYVTERRAAWYAATEAVPESVRMPVSGFQVAVIPDRGVIERNSSPRLYPGPMATVAPMRVVLSTSATERAGSMATRAPLVG